MNQLFGSSFNLRKDIVFTFALALACYVAWLVRDVLVLLYVSALFAVVLTPLVNHVSELHLGRWQPFKGRAILVLLVTVAGALTAFGSPGDPGPAGVWPGDAGAAARHDGEAQSRSLRRPTEYG
jgi:predicted PurR-regulated permease PerM